jgi:hypothetical protein
MAYIRSKVINGYGPYFYLVEGHWNGKNSSQKVIRYLGRNPDALHSAYGDGSGNGTSSAPDTNPGMDRPSIMSHETVHARDQINESALRSKDILAMNEAERSIIESSDAPESKKEKVEQRRVRKAAEELKVERDRAQRSLDDFYQEEVEASSRSKTKWSAQRKKEARSISEGTGCSIIQADAMNQRAKRAGRSYDEVSWDDVQGKDLTYSERVEKLDAQLGTRTRTKSEVARSSKTFESTVKQWEKDPDRYQEEMEAASREMFYDLKTEIY